VSMAPLNTSAVASFTSANFSVKVAYSSSKNLILSLSLHHVASARVPGGLATDLQLTADREYLAVRRQAD
jgi:hypothetical protein